MKNRLQGASPATGPRRYPRGWDGLRLAMVTVVVNLRRGMVQGVSFPDIRTGVVRTARPQDSRGRDSGIPLPPLVAQGNFRLATSLTAFARVVSGGTILNLSPGLAVSATYGLRSNGLTGVTTSTSRQRLFVISQAGITHALRVGSGLPAGSIRVSCQIRLAGFISGYC